MKKICILHFLLFFAFSVVAQQDPHFSNDKINSIVFNPAMAGSSNDFNVLLVKRNQWVGFDGAPQTSVVSLDFPMKLGNVNSGIGLSVMSDKLGMQKSTRLLLNYAYKKKLFSGVLSLGVSLDLINESFEGDFNVPKGEFFTSPDQDPLLATTNLDVSDVMYDLGVGLYYSDKNLCVGLSAMHLLQPSIKLTKSSEYYYKKNYFVYGKYIYSLSDKINLLPSCALNTDFNTIQYSVSTNFSYNNKYWIGASYRFEDAFIFMGGIKLFNGLKLGYAYDMTTSEMGKHSGGSHEFVLSYSHSIKIKPKKQKFKSVRFL